MIKSTKVAAHTSIAVNTVCLNYLLFMVHVSLLAEFTNIVSDYAEALLKVRTFTT